MPFVTKTYFGIVAIKVAKYNKFTDKIQNNIILSDKKQ